MKRKGSSQNSSSDKSCGVQANVVRIALKIDKLELIRRNNLSINRILEIAGSQNPHISLSVQKRL